MGPLTYVFLKMISSVMADLNVIVKFFMLFRTSPHVFVAENTSECVIILLTYQVWIQN